MGFGVGAEGGEGPGDEDGCADEPGEGIVEAGIVAEVAEGGLEVDHSAEVVRAHGGGSGVVEVSGGGGGGEVGELLVEEAGGDVGDPEDGGESDDCGDEEGLKSALAMDATGEEEVEPDEAGVPGAW